MKRKMFNLYYALVAFLVIVGIFLTVFYGAVATSAAEYSKEILEKELVLIEEESGY